MTGTNFATGRMNLGELEVRQVTNLELIASTDGTAFYKPVNIPEGFHILGYYAQSSNQPLDQAYLLIAKQSTIFAAQQSSERGNGGSPLTLELNPSIAAAQDLSELSNRGSDLNPALNSSSRAAHESSELGSGGSAQNPALKPPIDFTIVSCWKQNELRVYFWLPCAAEGYKPMGFVVTTTKEKPLVEKVRCVREDLTDQGVTDQCLWAPGKSVGCFNQSSPPSIWTVKPQIVRIDAKGVSVGAFSCVIKTIEKNSLPIAILRNVHLNLEAMPNLEQVHHLIKKHAPIVFFHPEETFLPCSVAWFFDNGALLHSRSSTTPSKVLSDGSNLPQGGSNDGEYWLDLPEDATAAELVKRGNLASAEAYIHVKPMHGGAFTDMVFWIFCPFNGGGVAKVGGMKLALGKLGQHVSDWEHFTLRVSNLSGKLTRIYFSQHRCGAWIPPWELQWESGRPIAYSGKGGHSSYHLQGHNLQGTEKLRFGLLNSTARSDNFFDTSSKYQIVSAEYLGLPEPPWLQFMREWGPKVVYSTKVKMDAVAKALLTSKVRSSVQGLSRKLPKIFYGEEGPTGPKQKNNWYGDERVASP